ncbi:MAG: hypothetical protein D6785_06015 [Planctomycetota bacterium]|nr:MAG: hypothetical protein D6785_06015 [Planctomycetota bacterium]
MGYLFLGLSLFFLMGVFFLLWKFQGIFHWRRSLKKELADLEEELEKIEGPRKEALQLIVNTGKSLLWSLDLNLWDKVQELPSYNRSIAAIYYPNSNQPELEVSLGRFLTCLKECSGRFQIILERPGFQVLQKVKISQIRQSMDWLENLKKMPLLGLIIRYWSRLSSLFRWRLIILPDPFSLVIYLSNHLTLLLLSKYLLLDLYLFVGKLALYAYDEKEEEKRLNEEEIEKALEELENLEENNLDWMDERLKEIKEKMGGWLSPPTVGKVKEALREGILYVSTKYFPDSPKPLEEACIGPLLERTYHWVQFLEKGKETKGLSYFYSFHLSTLFTLKEVGSGMMESLPSSLGKVAKTAFSAYRWLKWPRKVWKWIRKTSPLAIALDLGFEAGKRGVVLYISHYIYDTVIYEGNEIYRRSQELS